MQSKSTSDEREIESTDSERFLAIMVKLGEVANLLSYNYPAFDFYATSMLVGLTEVSADLTEWIKDIAARGEG